MKKLLYLSLLAALGFSLAAFTPSEAIMAASCEGQFVAETGHCVPAVFWSYWTAHGGLQQQGYPLSEAADEQAADGKTYLTQYFEQAVFQYHPENNKPYDVLLAPLGRLRYQIKYPSGTSEMYTWPTGNHTFVETGFSVGGKFYDYWATHGDLMQHGLPISAVFKEQSDTDNQEYYVQYFERAEFEWHQENKDNPDSEVLLPLLGTAAYQAIHGGAGNPPATDACADVPPPINGTVEPKCGPQGTVFRYSLFGYAADEKLSFWYTTPEGDVIGTAAPITFPAQGDALVGKVDSGAIELWPGLWSVTFEGERSRKQAIVYFVVR